MNNGLDNLILGIVVLINLFFGATIFKGNKDKRGLFFSAIILCIIFWSVSNYLAEIVSNHDVALFAARFTYLSASMIGLLFLQFVLIFPRKTIKLPKLAVYFYWFSGIALAIFSSTPLVTQDVQIAEPRNILVSGSFSLVFIVYFLIYMGASFVILLLKNRKAVGTEKTQIHYMFLGTFLAVLGASLTNLIIPYMTNNWFISRYGPYFTIFLVGFTTYAIVKHRLMDIRMVVARSVAFMVLLATIGLFYTFTMIWLEKIVFPHNEGSLSPGQIIFRIVLTLFVIFTFQPLKKWITKRTDKIFFKQTYDPDELLEELSRTMGSSIVLIELLYKVLNILTEEMKVSRGFFVILKDEKTIDTTQGVGYKRSPNLTLNEIDILCKEGVTIFDELDDNSKKKQILRKHDASIAIPLRTNNKFSGVLLLGEKSSGDMYSAQDVSIFEILGPEVTVAIENAKSYEEIQQFNAVLRTEIKKATGELESANHNLRELDKAKDEFITMASHQLRTPLTAIKGYLSMLMEGDAGEIKMGQYEFIQEAYYGATRMVSLINDLLNVSRMETGRFFLEVAEFDITRTVEEEIKQLEKGVKDKGLKLDFKHTGGQIKLCADEMKVRQVVMNFIDNAIYYTLNGAITVKLYEKGKDVCFEVTDKGIGVPREQQKHLFTKFYRAENARATRPDGTGLGLFMAKKVIEEHHGEIIFHSTEGKGSTFGFRLPKKAAVKNDSLSSFDSDIPLSTPVDKAIGIMDEKIKNDVSAEEKAMVKAAKD